MKITTLTIILIAVTGLASAATIEQYATADDGTPLHWKSTIHTGSKKYPVVILIPGGGFKHLFGIPSMVSQDIYNAGYNVFAQVEYRTAPPDKIIGQTSLGHFPNQTDDVTLATTAAAADSRCDGEVFAVGGSAGACHALYLAAKGLVKAAVCLSPPTQLNDPASLYGAFENDVNNYAPGKLKEASPNGMLTTNSSPVFIVAFAQDHIPAPQYDLAVSNLLNLGVPYEARLLPGAGHSWDCWPLVKDQAIAFLNAHRTTPTPTPTPTATSTPTVTPTDTPTPEPSATETPTPTPEARPIGIGIMYMIRSDYVDSKQKIPKSTDNAFNNRHVDGVTCRTGWDRIEPHEHGSSGDFYWGFLDGCVINAVSHNKKFSIMVAGGTTTPKWVYSAGATAFQVTEGDGTVEPMPLPWDAVFQNKWGAMQHEVATRYGNNPALAYVDLTVGRKVEADFVTTAKDVVTFNRLGGLTKWKQGVKWMIDKRFTEFPKVPSTFVTGAVVPNNDGQIALQEVLDYGVANHPGNHMACSSHGLWYPDGPGDNSIGAKEAMLLTNTSTPGFQFFGAVSRYGHKIDPQSHRTMMDFTLELAVKWGARFVEVRAEDCDDPVSFPALDKWGAVMKKN